MIYMVQKLGRNLGHKVSQATDSLSAADISELIDNDVPQVSPSATDVPYLPLTWVSGVCVCVLY